MSSANGRTDTVKKAYLKNQIKCNMRLGLRYLAFEVDAVLLYVDTYVIADAVGCEIPNQERNIRLKNSDYQFVGLLVSRCIAFGEGRYRGFVVCCVRSGF